MTILICTASTVNDPCIEMVIRAIEARGAVAYRLETDLFPTDLRLNISWDRKDRLHLSSSTGELDLTQVSAVWIRHMDTGARLPDYLDPDHREASRIESDL